MNYVQILWFMDDLGRVAVVRARESRIDQTLAISVKNLNDDTVCSTNGKKDGD